MSLDSFARSGEERGAALVLPADPQTRTFTAKVALQGMPGLSLGASGKPSFPGEAEPRGDSVRTAGALRLTGERAHYRNQGHTVRLRLWRAAEGRVANLSRLIVGERVAARNADRTTDGMRVLVGAWLGECAPEWTADLA